MLNYKKPAFWIIIVAIIASVVAAVCFLTDPVKDKEDAEQFFSEGFLFFDIGAESMESIESCTIIHDGNPTELILLEEDTLLFARYAYTDEVPVPELSEIFTYPKTKRIRIAVVDRIVTLYLMQDGCITVKLPEKGFSMYQAEEQDVITPAKYQQMVAKYTTLPDNTTEKFLKGEISATNKDGRKVSIQDYLRGDYNKYALYDMSGDAVPELIIKTGNGLTIFSVKEQSLTVWYEGTIYEEPLNNRAIFYERPGGAPEHTTYQYIVLDHNGEELKRTSFVESYGDNAEYFINGEKVSKTAYEDLYKSFNLTNDGIVWKDILSTPNQPTVYDRAIAAYYAFLNGQIAAIVEDNSKIFVSSYASISNGQSGFDRYALHDVNGDGIPELFIDAAHDHILAFDGENIRQWYSSMSWMGIQLLSSGAVVDTHSGAGSFINYLTFGPDGIEKFITFSGGPGGESGQYYYGEGESGSSKEVSKDEWEALTKPYFQQMENKAQLEWHTTIPTTPNSETQFYPTITLMLMDVLNNEKTFYNVNRQKNMILSDYQKSIWMYAAVDMDSDDNNELAVMFNDGKILILRQDGESVYGYDFGVHVMYQINTDGTFLWNKNAGNINGCSKLRFIDGNVETTELWRVERNESGPNMYYINASPVSEEDFQCMSAQSNRKSIKWTVWDKNTGVTQPDNATEDTETGSDVTVYSSR